MKITSIPPKPKPKKTTRVAAYARVSSEKDAAFHSVEAQKDYYVKYVAAREDWELVDVFSDEGISGTKIERPGFQRMLTCARNGEIDLIITKSITRFARNTVDLLSVTRELKALHVDVFFEKENMHSISPDGELLLTLLATFAEEEARSASENQLWRIQKLFEQGKPTGAPLYGYKFVDGKYEIVPEEAEVVRQIFADYLSGMGTESIAKKLNAQGVYPHSSSHWTNVGIYTILKNEKYVGDLLLQKSYRDDFRTKKKKQNNKRAKRQYYVQNAHDAIISRDAFSAVADEMDRRAAEAEKLRRHVERSVNYFAGIVHCGICGMAYVRHTRKSSRLYRELWACDTFEKYGKISCDSQRIPDAILIHEAKEVLGVTELTPELVHEKIEQIVIPAHNTLLFYLADGSIVERVWEHESRSKSWTPEMKQKARERSVEQYRRRKEREKNDT